METSTLRELYSDMYAISGDILKADDTDNCQLRAMTDGCFLCLWELGAKGSGRWEGQERSEYGQQVLRPGLAGAAFPHSSLCVFKIHFLQMHVRVLRGKRNQHSGWVKAEREINLKPTGTHPSW